MERSVQAALVALADGSILRSVLALLVQERGQPAILQPISFKDEAQSVALWTPLLLLIQRLLNLSGHKTQYRRDFEMRTCRCVNDKRWHS